MNIENSYFFNPQCDNIKNLIRLVSFGLLILVVFAFMFVTSSRSILVFLQLLQILVVSYLVYLNLSWPDCDPGNYNNNLMNNNQRSQAARINALTGNFGAARTTTVVQQPVVDAINVQPSVVG